jgi:hypothetical protein
MSKRTDYTSDEWKTITSAPVLAGLLISVSDMSGPIGMAKEAYTVIKTVTDTAAGSSNELIKAVAEEIKARGGKPDLPNLPQDKAGVTAMLINGCKQAVELVAKKSPAEAEAYKQWVISLAQKTAEASKEGGFLGIGGTPVSDEEKSAVENLASALNMRAKA